MAARPVLITAIIAISLALPLALPFASGSVVAVTVGPIALEASRNAGLAFDVDPDCLSSDCPMASLRIATIERPAYLAGL